MFTLSGFKNIAMIHEGSQKNIYSAVREKNQLPVIIIVLRSENPQINEIALMYHELDISKEINLPGVIKTYSLVEDQKHYALVQEDIQGIYLSEYIKEQPIDDVTFFLKIAIKIVGIIDDIHRDHIIHKDIKPANFIIEPNTLTIKLTGFRFAAKLLHESQDIVPTEKLEGTLSYMAPEQTGRMDMNIDYRSDFYALGVTFYELLTGELPFLILDPLELVHAHLATPAPDASVINPNIPKSLAGIVLKLMAKDPSKRYQSATGIQADLERCVDKIDADFILGQEDVHDRLNISPKLYGRQEEVDILLDTYKRVTQGSVEALMVSGYSGIGKTMLINTLHKPMVEHKGYFITGKFDQLQRNTPYTAITQALNHLAKLILSEQDERYEEVKKALSNTLGNVSQVIIDLAPEFEKILGKPPPLEKLPPQQSQNRMMLYFKRFMQVIASDKHPLVIFIDDLQWVDSGSLQLLEYILTDVDLTHVLLIGAYRDNEVDELHPLRGFFKDKSIQFVSLEPLTPQHFQALFIDSFYRKDIMPLAELIHRRTNGNPFFCRQVINTVYQHGLLYFDYEQRRWDWNLYEIETLSITENVVDLMLSKFEKLPLETQNLLRYGSCVGNQFTIHTMALVTGQGVGNIGKILWPAMKAELILTLSLGYKRIEAIRDESLALSLSKKITYKFIHDKVQQAVYESISHTTKQQMHLTIAKMITRKEPEACKKERLFEVVDHFNNAHDLLSPREKIDVVELNHQAAVNAMNAIAYQPMKNYISAAQMLLDEYSWNTHYDMTFKVNRDAALNLFLLGNYTEAETKTNQLLLRTQTRLDKVSIYQIQTQIYTLLGRETMALKTGCSGLELLGHKIPLHPTKLQILNKYLQVKWELRRFHLERIEDELHELTDPYITAVFEILVELNYPSFFKDLNLFNYMGLTGIVLLLKYGRPKNAGYWFSVYAFFQLKVFNDIEGCCLSWDVSQRLFLKNPHQYSSCRAFVMGGLFFAHLLYHRKEAMNYLKRAREEALVSGNLMILANASISIADVITECKTLKKGREAYSAALKTTADIKHLNFKMILQLKVITTDILTSGVKKDKELSQLVEAIEKTKNITFVFSTYRLLHGYCYFSGNDNNVVKYYGLMLNGSSSYPHQLSVVIDETLAALVFSRYIVNSHGINRWRFQRQFIRCLSHVKWCAEKCPYNFQHLYLILKATRLKMKEKYSDALSVFDEAIENARKEEYLLFMALGNELAGDMLMERRQLKSATLYIRDAHYYYERYGMIIKVNALENRYPDCFLQIHDEAKHVTKSTQLSSMSTTSSGLDFTSVIKASQSISGEIEIESLFAKMLHIIIENTGAQKAVFIELRKNKFQVSATLEQLKVGEQFHMLNTSLEEFADVSHAVIHASLRAKKPIIINNAKEDSTFAHDAYILRTAPKSILCLPVIQHDDVLALIYVENNLTVGAFTEERITVLQTLSAQITISLENARHFEETEILYKATERFVPKQFLKLLNKQHVEDIMLGDSIEKEITIMFSDIRQYTSITEALTPKEAFGFINGYLKIMGPIIRTHNGFINQYQGDAIMALFPRSADDGIRAVRDMAIALVDYNHKQKKLGLHEIQVGYGLNSGLVMLGTIGEEERMDANVISDAINLASRVESLNKFYNTNFLASDSTINALSDKKKYVTRLVDKVRVKGKKEVVYLYEVYFESTVDTQERVFIDKYEAGFEAYATANFEKAIALFSECKKLKSSDVPCDLLIERCQQLRNVRLPDNWDGTYDMAEK